MEFSYNEKTRMVKIGRSNKDIYDYFKNTGFFFPNEILTRYFLSLKTKPFVILTGISGTGKTKIAQIFADYICQDDTPGQKSDRIAFISVRPDWMDNKGFLGYYNLLDEKYHTTPVLKILLEAEKNPDKPYFVILDEMNLAKVEQYFSDFLSIMESRTSNKPQGELLHLHSKTVVESQDGILVLNDITIPPNIFFTGTVNIDESTYMFSPKVLDRANVIEFNEVELESYARGFSQSEQFVLKDANVIGKLFTSDSSPFCSRADYEQTKKETELFFQSILSILYPYNLHFGYRVINEISRFVLNTKDAVHDFDIDDVLDIQTLQKILPKFHGTQAKLEEPLKKLFMLCTNDGIDVNDPLFLETNNEVKQEDVRFPRSARKLSRMLRNLKIQGYTSFIE